MKSNVILLIEDDYLDVVSIERALKKLNVVYTLHIAHNGEDALSLLNGNVPNKEKIYPNIILLDLNMPKMNGIEFLRIIKNYYTFNNIKVFVTTTSAEEYDRLAVEQLGIAGYILKPIEFTSNNKDKTGDVDKLLAELTLN